MSVTVYIIYMHGSQLIAMNKRQFFKHTWKCFVFTCCHDDMAKGHTGAQNTPAKKQSLPFSWLQFHKRAEISQKTWQSAHFTTEDKALIVTLLSSFNSWKSQDNSLWFCCSFWIPDSSDFDEWSGQFQTWKDLFPIRHIINFLAELL